MSLQEFYQKRFHLRKHGGLNHADLYELAPFEFEIEWRMVLSELKAKD